MKRILLAGAAIAALTTASYAADPVYEEVDVWTGYFVGIQAGGTSSKAELFLDSTADDTVEVYDHGFVGGLYYGRNWQSGNWVFGLDSSFSYIGWSEDLDDDVDGEPTGTINNVEVDADFLGLSRLRVGYTFDSFMFFIAGGVASTVFDVEMGIDGVGTTDDDDWAFGWTIGAGVEGKISDNWSARLEAIYAVIESDDIDGSIGGTAVATEVDFETTIIRGGVAYHF